MFTEYTLLFSTFQLSSNLAFKIILPIITTIFTTIITYIINEMIDYDNSFIATTIEKIVNIMTSIIVHGILLLSLHTYFKSNYVYTSDINFCVSFCAYFMLLSIVIDIFFINILEKKLDIISFSDSIYKDKYILIAKNKELFKFIDIKDYINQYHKKKNNMLNHNKYFYTNINNINDFEKCTYYILSSFKNNHHKIMICMSVILPLVMILLLILGIVFMQHILYAPYIIFTVFIVAFISYIN